MNDVVEVAPQPTRSTSLVVRTAQRFGVDADKLMVTLKATAFKTDKPISNETMMALLIVADQYKLNPFTRELYAFPDKRGGIVPVVSIDGWIRIVNEHPQYNGCTLDWIEAEKAYRCTMHRKDREHPIVITEFMDECYRFYEPWKSHPRRMLRHKALIQGARVAFGFAGIYDEDEAERIAASRVDAVTRDTTGFERIRAALRDDPVPEPVEIIDAEPASSTTAENLAELLRNLAESPDEESAQLVLEEGRAWVTAEQHLVLQRAYAAKYSKEGDDPSVG